MFRLDGKVALITGSTRGLGWAMAQAMADVGAHVVINGRHDETVMAKTAELSLGGSLASGIAFDVADPAAAVGGVETVIERHGAIDILVNNAGIQHRSPIADFDQAEWDRVMAVNLHAPFALARAAAVHMVAAGFGRIINTGSVMSQIARPTIPAYVASKSGIAGMTRALAVELAPHGVTVNAIGPGYVATEMNTALVNDPEFDAMVRSRTPAARWGRPAEIAAAAVFLASNQASFVNGHLLMVDGGLSVAL